MPQAAALNEAIQLLGEIGRVVACSFQSLGHQQDFEAGSVSLGNGFRQMLLKQAMADPVDVFIHLKHFTGTFQIQIRESLMDKV